MTHQTLKRVISLSIIIILFVGAAALVYFFLVVFPNLPKGLGGATLPDGFLGKVYPDLEDTGKFFPTILTGVFVASITFSEKIVDLKTATLLPKLLLVLCWILLLLSIVCDGVGATWISFALAGIVFGLSLTSMLAAGIISFVNQSMQPS